MPPLRTYIVKFKTPMLNCEIESYSLKQAETIAKKYLNEYESVSLK